MRLSFFCLRTKTVTQHEKSTEHERFVQAGDSRQSKVVAGLQAVEEKKWKAVFAALETAYFVILEEMTNRKYKSLLKFLRHMKLEAAINLLVGGNATYDSLTIFNELLACLSTVSSNRLRKKLNNSKFIGIGIDESTDMGTRETCCPDCLVC